MNVARHDTTAVTPSGADEARIQRRHLIRVRYAVRGVLFLGVAASLAANMLHAEPNNYSRTIAAWPPLALFATIEVISRVPVSRAWLAGVRVVSTIVIGGIAAWVSYWHMVAVVGRFGEQGATPYLLPFSVDGLVIVASVSLLELADRIRHLQQPRTTPAAAGPETATAPAQTRDARAPQNLPPTNGSGPPVPGAGERPNCDRDTAGDDADEVTPSGTSDVTSKVVDLRRRQPGIDVATIATQVGRSKRTVQRIMKTLEEQQRRQAPVNGAEAPDLLSAGQRR